MNPRERIILAASKIPALRFGQFIDNALATCGKEVPLFYVTDAELASICEKFVNHFTNKE